MKRGVLFSIVFIMHMYAFGAFAQTKDVADWTAIKSELELMFTTDQAMRVEYNTMRAEARAKGVEVDKASQAALWKRIGEQDRANQQRVTAIVDKYGWPKNSQVGQLAAMAAFLVVQHASLDVQLRYVAHLREATALGEASTQNLALLEDRLLIRQGIPQR